MSLYGDYHELLGRKTDSQNDENNKPLYHPHAEQSRVGWLESNLVKCVNDKRPTKSEICWATIIMTSDCVIVSIKEYLGVGNDE